MSSPGKPPYCEIHGKWWTWRPYADGRLQGRVRLCPADAPIERVWREFLKAKDRAETVRTDTLQHLVTRYFGSDQFAAKSADTQRGYRNSAKLILAQKLGDGRTFGQVPHRQITTPVLQRLHDAMSRQAVGPDGVRRGGKVAANRNIGFLSAMFSWAQSRIEGVSNPAKAVIKHGERGRTRYVDDAELRAALRLAPPKLLCVMAIEVICRARPGEPLLLTDNHILPEGLHLWRKKGSREQIIAWSDELRAIVAYAQSLRRGNVVSLKPWLFQSVRDPGSHWTDSARQNAATRFKAQLAKAGIEHFTMHDLKAKGVSDALGDKHEAGGWQQLGMAKIYDRKIPIVEPTPLPILRELFPNLFPNTKKADSKPA